MPATQGGNDMRSFVLVLTIVYLAILPSLGRTVDESVVLYLPFDEGTGAPRDGSLKPASVAIKGSLKWVGGKFGQALEFDGAAANYVEVSHSDKLDGMKALTIDTWVMPYNPDVNARAIVSKRSSQGLQVSSETVLKDKTWYHVAYTFDGDAASGKRQNLYVDGQLEMTKEHLDDSVGKSETSLWIGILNAGYAQAWQGIIDEVRVWNRALNEAEVELAMQGKLGAAIHPKGKLTATWGTLKHQLAD